MSVRSIWNSPNEWAQPYHVLAVEVNLDPDLSAGHRSAATFLDPVLADEFGLTQWDAETSTWQHRLTTAHGT